MKRIFAICTILAALATAPLGAAELTFDVDPDGGGDYLSLNAWVAAQQQDLTDAGGDTMIVTCTSSSGTADTTAVNVDGSITSAAFDITIIASTSDRPADKWDTSKYRLESTTATTVVTLTISDNNVTVDGLQVGTVCTGSYENGSFCIRIAGNADEVVIQNCIIRGTQTGDNAGHWEGFYDNFTARNFYLFNCVIYYDAAGYAAINGHTAISNRSGTMLVYNCTLAHSRSYAIHNTGTCTAINCISYSCDGQQFDGTFEDASNFNATDDSSLDYTTGGGGDDNLSAAFTFEAAANFDFRLASGDAGAKDLGSGAAPSFTTDIKGDTRPGVDLDWDIGAFEFIAPPAGGGVSIIRSYF